MEKKSEDMNIIDTKFDQKIIINYYSIKYFFVHYFKLNRFD